MTRHKTVAGLFCSIQFAHRPAPPANTTAIRRRIRGRSCFGGSQCISPSAKCIPRADARGAAASPPQAAASLGRKTLQKNKTPPCRRMEHKTRTKQGGYIAPSLSRSLRPQKREVCNPCPEVDLLLICVGL